MFVIVIHNAFTISFVDTDQVVMLCLLSSYRKKHTMDETIMLPKSSQSKRVAAQKLSSIFSEDMLEKIPLFLLL